jgi:hypothetical protein
LGASPGETLLYIILPLSHAGIVAGVVFTLVPLMTAFVEAADAERRLRQPAWGDRRFGAANSGGAQFPTACRRL